MFEDLSLVNVHRRLQRKASKKQMITKSGTLEFAEYVIVFTTRLKTAEKNIRDTPSRKEKNAERSPARSQA